MCKCFKLKIENGVILMTTNLWSQYEIEISTSCPETSFRSHSSIDCVCCFNFPYETGGTAYQSKADIYWQIAVQ